MFQLLKGAQRVTTYIVNTESTAHLLCKRWDVQSFSTHHSDPGGFSIPHNAEIEGITWSVVIEEFNGSNWKKTRKGPKTIKIISKH